MAIRDQNFEMISFKQFDFLDKDKAVERYCFDMLNRISSMFKYDGDIPETFKTKYMDQYLFYFGHCCIAEHKNQLYAFFGSWGGEPDAYYTPVNYIVANPYLDLNKTFQNGKDCVVIRNDRNCFGLKSMFEKHATMLVENDISRLNAEYNSRIQDLFAAEDDKTKKSAELFLKRVIEGKLGVVSSNAMLDSFKAYRQTSASNGTILPLIEHHQYIKSEWLSDLGIDSNWNGKREAVNSAETSLNQDYLHPLIDDMLRERQEAFEKVKELFGVDIKVSLDSAWLENQKESELELKQLDPEETKDNPEETKDNPEEVSDNDK